MSWTRVKNVNGSGRYSPPSGYTSWLDYWENKLVREWMCAEPMDAMEQISSGLMFRKQIVMTTVGMSPRFAEHVTIGLTNSMSILISFQFRVIFNKRLLIVQPCG